MDLDQGASKRFGLQWESAERLLRRYLQWKPRPTEVHGFDLVSGRDGDIAWIGISGDFDLIRVPEVEKEIRKAEGSNALRVVISLRDVTHLDSSALRLLLDARSRMRGRPGRLRFLRSRYEPVIELLQVTETEDAFY
jgi:anti-anti-sigma factor